ncbi:MAG: hypothetical protein GY798_29635 [Hyphomicrobiales bacterium]|nr:hypothetical protein [Hyphomicrobiales bacterium]
MPRFIPSSLLVAGVLAGAVASAMSAVPGRVVSINLCADELLVGLADPEQIAGLSIFATNPRISFLADQAAAFRHDPGPAEIVVEPAPDLVLAGRYTKRATCTMLSALGYEVVPLEPARTIDDSIDQIRQVAALVGHPALGRLFPAEARIILPERLTVCGGPSLPTAFDTLATEVRRVRGQP